MSGHAKPPGIFSSGPILCSDICLACRSPIDHAHMSFLLTSHRHGESPSAGPGLPGGGKRARARRVTRRARRFITAVAGEPLWPDRPRSVRSNLPHSACHLSAGKRSCPLQPEWLCGQTGQITDPAGEICVLESQRRNRHGLEHQSARLHREPAGLTVGPCGQQSREITQDGLGPQVDGSRGKRGCSAGLESAMDCDVLTNTH